VINEWFYSKNTFKQNCRGDYNTEYENYNRPSGSVDRKKNHAILQ